MTLGGRSILVIFGHIRTLQRRHLGLQKTERSHMVLFESYNNVPNMTLGGRSILVILWSHENVTKRTFGTLTERSHMVLY